MEYTCGCKTSIDPQRASLGYKIDYCPKHSACEDMYEALKAQQKAIDILFAKLIELDKTFFPSKSGQPWEAIIQGKKALAKVDFPSAL